MFKTLIAALVFAFAATNAAVAGDAAETAAPVKKRVTSALVTLKARVVSVDQETREVTLQDAEGREHTFIASQEVRNLPQVEVGDWLVVQYAERVAVKLYPVEAAGLGSVAKTEVSRADLGQKPHGTITRTTEFTGRVAALDRDNRIVTLEGKHGSLELAVRDDVDLTNVNVGDMVKMEYIESVAMTIRSAQEMGE
jgi:hypothetical protein